MHIFIKHLFRRRTIRNLIVCKYHQLNCIIVGSYCVGIVELFIKNIAMLETNQDRANTYKYNVYCIHISI